MSRSKRRGEGRQADHGARALARRLRENRLDRRTWIAKARSETERMLADDRGGVAACTNSELLAIRAVAPLVLIVEAQASWLLKQLGENKGAPIGPDGSPLSLLLKSFSTHHSNLMRGLVALGLRPDAIPKGPGVADFLREFRDAPQNAQNRPEVRERDAVSAEVCP